MPDLEPINDPATYIGKKPDIAKSKGKAAQVSADDDMPPLEPINDPPSYTGKKAEASKPKDKAAHIGDDDDMPPLEPLDQPKPNINNKGTKPEANKSKGRAAHVSEDEDMPALEPINQPAPKNKGKQAASSTDKTSTPTAGSSSNNNINPTSAKGKQAASKKDNDDADDDMPALEPIDQAKSSLDPDSSRRAALAREPEFKRRMRVALSSLGAPPEAMDQFRDDDDTVEREADEFDPNDDLDMGSEDEEDDCNCYTCMLERMGDEPPGDAGRAARDARLREIARRNGFLSSSEWLSSRQKEQSS